MKPETPSSSDHIRRRAERMQHTRKRAPYSALTGLSAFGVIGWSVALPTVSGALLGLWLDRVAPQAFSWPIALMLGGLVIGIIVAAEWVMRENRRTQLDESVPVTAVAPDAKPDAAKGVPGPDDESREHSR